jgi:4-hydroxybenzoate polyprenyltransferase
MADRSTTSTPPAALASVWDLDGTLLRTDVFCESLLRILVKQPWRLPQVAMWLARGIPYCKGRVAELTNDSWTTWPVHEGVAGSIEADRRAGRPIVLATAAHERVARSVAGHLGPFDAILATTDTVNLKGRAKSAAILAWVESTGCGGFTYAGDSFADLAIWRVADEAIIVRPTPELEKTVRGLGRPVTVIGERRGAFVPILRAMRPHQWAKNLLLFVPALLAHRVSGATLASLTAAFVSFSACASAIYVFNDLVDLQSDRDHPEKRRRPFASGDLSLASGVCLAALLAAISAVIALVALPPAFFAVVLGYAAANICYSTWLKRKPIVDVMMLASMYTARIEAGRIAAQANLSHWLLAFSVFFFTSLAFVKRDTELRRLESEGKMGADGRGYLVSDIPLLESFGTASGYVSILVLALYMNSTEMRSLYGETRLLWLVCLLVMYWLTRIWLLARRGVLDEDPVLYAVRDPVSILIGGACVALVAVATLQARLATP